jgi:hypothetical protein
MRGPQLWDDTVFTGPKDTVMFWAKRVEVLEKRVAQLEREKS